MRVRALDVNGDWTFGSGLNNYKTGQNAAAQAIGTRLLLFLGDCFWNTKAGIDWFNFLGGSKSTVALELAVRSQILNTQSDGQNVVTEVVNLSLNLNDVTRLCSITYLVTTIFGPVTGTVNQNLGIGLMAPVSNLLPQFNQTLLNNVGATAVNNAIFDHTLFWEIDLEYYAERRTSTQGFIQRGTLVCSYDPYSSTWSIADDILAGSSGPTTGITFTINASTGQVYYASDDVTGSSYVGNLIMQSLETFKAGV